MAFIKVRNIGKTDIIINTDMISCIRKDINGDYFVILANGSFIFDKGEAKKIFDCIGIALD